MTRPRDGTYLWVTWLSKLMAGEAQCTWAAWFRTHYMGYERAPSDFQLAQWTAEHTRALFELADTCLDRGETVFREDENQFKLQVTRQMTLAGKPDLVALGADGSMMVYDVKTGVERRSDVIQVMLYMLCLPVTSQLYRGRQPSGAVVYREGKTIPIPSSALDDTFRASVRYFVNKLDEDAPPERRPTASECRYCDITALDCPERIEPDPSGPDPETRVT